MPKRSVRGRYGKPRRRRLLAARLTQFWGLCTVLVSGFVSVVVLVSAAERAWEEVFRPPDGTTDWVLPLLLTLAVAGALGWLLVAGWFAFSGLRRVVHHVAGRPIRLWPSGAGFGGGDATYGGGDGGGGDGGGGDGGGC